MQKFEIVSLDEREAIKRKIIYPERLYSHLFCFAVTLSAGLIAMDCWFLLSDLWTYLHRSQYLRPPTYYYLDHSVGYLAFNILMPNIVLLSGLALGLLGARAFSRISRRSFLVGRLIAVAMLTAMGVFSYVVLDGRVGKFFDLMLSFFSVPFAHWASTLEIAILVTVIILIQASWGFRATPSLFHLNETDAYYLRDNPDQGFFDRVLRTVFGIPRIVDFLPNRQWKTAALFVLANTFYAMSTLFFMVGMLFMFVHWADAFDTCGPARQACLAEKAYVYLGLSLAGALVALYVAPIVAGRLNMAGQRQIRLSVDELLERDHRAPILFLRSFADDQVQLNPARIAFLGRVGNWLASIRNLDSVLLDEGTPYGPVVAIGNPRDKLPPYGAARGYFNDKTWQQAVLDLAEKSKAIVICIDDFDGIWWEIENVAAKHFDKTLLLVHPRHLGSPANERMVRHVVERMSADPRSSALLSALDHKENKTGPQGPNVLGAFIAPGETVRISVSTTFSQLAFLIEVRTFLRSKWGLAAREVA